MPRVKTSGGVNPGLQAEQAAAAEQVAASVAKVAPPRPASAATSAQPGKAPPRLTVPHDIINEQVIISAALLDGKVRRLLAARLKPDHFFGSGHAAIWDTVCELERRALDYSAATARQLSGGKVDESYLARLLAANPKQPANLQHHVETLEWDRARIDAARGPLHQLLEAMQRPTTSPGTIQGMARQLAISFQGYGDRKYLRDPAELTRQQLIDIADRRVRKQCWPFGLDGLDVDRDTGEPRLIPGCAPGQISVITGCPGSGKSTAIAQIASSMVDQRRKLLFGAWEMKDGMTLELIAGMRLGFSRLALQMGNLSDEQMVDLATEMEHVCQYVRFLDLPFGRTPGGKQRITNQQNLDLIHGYLADSGCEVAVFDLWKRCLRETKPDEEEEALLRQQAIAKETNIHCILVQQQRSKDIEMRDDKRPTREGIKGSGAWVEVPDTILGTNRPALWKRVEDNTFEIVGLKQRWGKWPFAVEFDWDGEHGSILNGRTVAYDPPGTNSNEADDWFTKADGKAKKGFRS